MNALFDFISQPGLMLWVWELTCLGLFWSIFCRSVRVSKTTRLDIRLAPWLVGIASLVGLGAPLYGWMPNIVVLMIVGSVAILQMVMSQHWRQGVPYHFLDPKYQQHRRTGDLRL